ncbi:MAG: hypothetical protein A3E88_00830 [Legionellales bacterium RIFCSPHIGHO2_12_FULL_35_11]|nr:MAG: hypothetical protein A3E88_00830 [Legionellales bacterium RIFCSPHIGHO2_12_FULL_35_11]
MTITQEFLKKIAKMAYINEEDAANLFPKIKSTLEEIELLKNLDTSMIEPFTHPSSSYQYMRDDISQNNNHTDEFSNIAPSFTDGNFLVPNIMQNGE